MRAIDFPLTRAEKDFVKDWRIWPSCFIVFIIMVTALNLIPLLCIGFA